MVVAFLISAGTYHVYQYARLFQRMSQAINFALIGVTGIDAGLLSTPLGRAKGNTFSVRPQITGPATRLS